MNNKVFLFVFTGIVFIVNALFSSIAQFVIGTLLIIVTFWLSHRKLKKCKEENKKFPYSNVVGSFLLLLFLLYLFFTLQLCGMAMTEGRNIFTNKCKLFSNTCIPWYYKSVHDCGLIESRYFK